MTIAETEAHEATERPSLPQAIAKSAARLKLERRRRLIAELANLEAELISEGIIRRPALVTKASLERGERWHDK